MVPVLDRADKGAMASAQTRIAETVALFYTADRTSDVSLCISVLWAKLMIRERWLDMLTSLRWMSLMLV